MAEHIIGIAEMKVSHNAGDTLTTYSLGSCVAVALYDPEIRVGGLIHCLLPLSSLDPSKAQSNPLMFADTGIMTLLDKVFGLGAERDRLISRIIGAASVMNDNGIFRIGERNYGIARRVLDKNRIRVVAESVGGTVARSVFLHMEDGKTIVRSCGTEEEL